MRWRELYSSNLQALYAPLVVPAIFLAGRLVARAAAARPAVVPGARRFMTIYATVFALETMLDPIIGGPVLRRLDLAASPFATVVLVIFVLLGDFRVFLLLFVLAAYTKAPSPPRSAVVEAAAWTLIVPTVAALGNAGARAIAGDLPSQSIWLAYEIAFFVLALVLRSRIVPARVPAAQPQLRAYLRRVTAYVALYYALWASADVLILAGVDLGWALRILPNQLYYALYVPFVFVLFFSRRYAATSASVQTSR